ncbi:MAG: hypothetical protein COV07_00785 [Candidatus Vogelbacteria bacterium CG10_big_fil_rev_8_21_14_0_10_45_14]|uniref:ROK family protein n=1 Tax=Candidatus Vogelbacteria bacterium CG10_big_fil_rev_8_21_14_0_10_45_14 TaxID=1975042 RepID=A0A2H0RKV2_9BACT|nr:MAG: hypothetical protein COV07_00785 [Candidatus Vogelbacteria bacterium CG10_big_fil_rev_8_21_14_0_10_45_14]
MVDMYLLFDIGGTKTRIAGSEDGVSFGEPVVVRTPQNFGEAMTIYESEAKKILAGGICERAVVGVPGSRDKNDILTGSRNLRGWEGMPFRESMERTIRCGDVVIENDASLVGLGEAVYGAGRGYDIVGYVTVSTGLGGAKIENGNVDKSSHGFEPGKMLIDGKDGPVELEEAVSGGALHKRMGVHPRDISPDDPVWEELATILAQGVHNLLVTWSPDVFVLGGSMIVGDPAISVASVERELLKLKHVFPKPPVLKKAKLGDFGGLWGGLAYLANQN